MSECYPQGCAPCTSPIDFPDSPVDGDRYCVPIGSMGEQKCWVYDKCVPGWRAEGPATSPTRYRGVINVCIEKPSNFDEQAGDWLIAAEDCAQAHFTWGLNLVNISAGDRIAFDGTQWQDFPPPEVPYAEEARDGDKPDPDDRVGGIVRLATVGQVEEGTNKCDPVTPYTLKEGFTDNISEIVRDSDLFDATCVDLDPEATASNPDNVAIFEPIEVDGEATWRIGCKDLTLGTNALFGVGKIATAFSNDADSYGDGYYSDWLTNSAMAPIIDAINERLSQLEANNPGGGVPVETVRVIKAYRNTNAAVGTPPFGPITVNWTPVDAPNLVHIDIVAAGGSGGAACGENSSVATNVTASAPNSVYVLKENIPLSAHGNDLTITVGGPGRGTGMGVTPNYAASPGGDTLIPLTNFEDIIAGGSNAGNGQAGTPSSGFDRNVSEGLTVIYGGGQNPANLGNQAGPCPVASGWGAHGQGGNVLIYEHYPVDWVDPRPSNFVNF